ncbi:FBP domain-containing protein [Marisediminicola senii]|uniref:FBP domain-containing protein n=1 Tax=Marisediminicola senii TaxID=2711233 RepID=UPI0013EAFA38|nr:FBP domain-containing protein [Marisediminicola senii]
MKPLTAEEIRTSMVNATRGEIDRMPLPGLHEVLWEDREYLGWRDPRAPLRGFLVHWVDDRAVGITLQASGATMRPGISAMCSLCRTPQPADQVRLYAAPRAGQAGRDGNTVGTYICADLACSLIIRITPPASAMQPDPAAVVSARADALLDRVTAFTAGVMKTA